ncbi:hypothetical protein [Lactiplantibacillus fabifermentans]|uniref:Cell surface protein n=1 Tax=Lactiplantibacillus fabifermentans T30PCM01 TaxID=1400520 RepID=W6T9R5_9LACO|nr:hypothetical protein [Lactiplantibacillus fabifermentans]ETY75224.1 cell surface protein [Lactiplantibacillus fabifermentans T30PCM01]
MYRKHTILWALLSLTLLTGCGATTTSKSSSKADVQTKTVYVTKRNSADAKAWSAAKAESAAYAASAKKLSESASTVEEAHNQASSQSSELADSHSESVAAVKASSESAASSAKASSKAVIVAARASSKAAAKSASVASSQASSQAVANSKAASSQAAQNSQTATTSTNHANNFSGDTDTAQTGRIVGNSRSKIYHVETGHNYHMAGKNAVYFSTEAQAQAAGYRKSYR